MSRKPCFIIGRRGGKSQSEGTLAAYISALCEHQLAPGERGVCLCIAPDQRQATIVLDYATAALEQSPILKQLIANRTSDALELTNGISIEVRAASFRRLRGPTYVCVIADESAYWQSDEWSSNPDVEIINAVKPGLATTGGPLIIASSPYARRGVLWDVYRKHWGAKGDKLILVAKGASRTLNPSSPAAVVKRAYERDRVSAAAEYGAAFRTDVEAFVSLDVVEQCVGDHIELLPADRTKYFAAVDPSGGSADSAALAVAYADGPRIVIAALREIRAPHSPEIAIDEFVTLLRSYRVRQVVGDRYAGEFPREQFCKRGIEYRLAERTKSDAFRDLLPLLNSKRILLPRSDRLVNQLVGLERRTTRAGKDSIDHAPNSHDDIANSVALAASLIATARKAIPPSMDTWDFAYAKTAWHREEAARREAEANVAAGSRACEINFGELERPRLKNHVEGATVRRGVVYGGLWRG